MSLYLIYVKIKIEHVCIKKIYIKIIPAAYFHPMYFWKNAEI